MASLTGKRLKKLRRAYSTFEEWNRRYRDEAANAESPEKLHRAKTNAMNAAARLIALAHREDLQKLCARIPLNELQRRFDTTWHGNDAVEFADYLLDIEKRDISIAGLFEPELFSVIPNSRVEMFAHLDRVRDTFLQLRPDFPTTAAEIARRAADR